MNIRTLHSPADLNAYDLWAGAHAEATLWQSIAWKNYQEAVGRTTRLYAGFEGDAIVASALVVIDRTSFGLSTWDVPRGPLWELGSGEMGMKKLLDTIIGDAKQNKCLSIFLSPLNTLPPHLPTSPSPRHEQPEATRIVDVSKDDEEILAAMHQKGRYNIKVAQKGGVTVRLSQDVEAYYALMKQTGERDQFGIKPLSHYKAFLEEIPDSFLLLAYGPESDAVPVAGLIGVIDGSVGIYYYGASSYAHRALMAPYALQWEAIKHCKAAGCTSYDLLGVAPEHGGMNHPWAGISSFKEKFGGIFVTYPPEQQIVLRPMVLKALQMKRKILG